MTVKAHIRTRRAFNEYGTALNPTQKEIDVWLITITESLTNKTVMEVKGIIGIQNETGIWITTPLDNKFWIITNNSEGFNVQEFETAKLDDFYTIFEIDEALDGKADAKHKHMPEDIIDLVPVIESEVSVLTDNFNLFFEKLIRELTNQ